MAATATATATAATTGASFPGVLPSFGVGGVLTGLCRGGDSDRRRERDRPSDRERRRSSRCDVRRPRRTRTAPHRTHPCGWWVGRAWQIPVARPQGTRPRPTAQAVPLTLAFAVSVCVCMGGRYVRGPA
jgi:hypothetical protein